MNTLTIIALIGIVLINPICDALIDLGKKRISKNIELLRDLCIFLLVYATTNDLILTVLLGFAYFMFRISFHNLAYNLTAKKPWYYTGTTSYSDELENKASKKEVLMARLITLLFGCFLLWLAFWR